jgi:hypothetical protein
MFLLVNVVREGMLHYFFKFRVGVDMFLWSTNKNKFPTIWLHVSSTC